MTRIAGIDTIAGLSGSPPMKIDVSYRTMAKQQRLLPQWNGSYIAMIPFCFKCKHPLDWFSPPEDDILFSCPSCGRVWVKGDDWNVQGQP